MNKKMYVDVTEVCDDWGVSRARTSLKERIEANKRIVAEREREKEKSRQHNRGMSR